jgi:hypothetical protein
MLMRLDVVAWRRQQPAPHEFADGRCSAGETILESELVDRREFFGRQQDLKTPGALTFACAHHPPPGPFSSSLPHLEPALLIEGVATSPGLLAAVVSVLAVFVGGVHRSSPGLNGPARHRSA